MYVLLIPNWALLKCWNSQINPKSEHHRLSLVIFQIRFTDLPEILSERNAGADHKQMNSFTSLRDDGSHMHRQHSAAWHFPILIPNHYTFARSQAVILSCGQVTVEYRYCHLLNFQVGKLAENTFKYQCLAGVHWGLEADICTDFLQSWDDALAIQNIQISNMPRKKHLVMQFCVECHWYGNRNW